MIEIIHGDCVEEMRKLAPDSADAIVTDPPYLLGFMGKQWDKAEKQQEWHAAWAIEALRVLKPGGHLLAFGGTRTYHRMTCAIEDAGFEIRDCIQWIYGSGFPKSLDVSKAIDKAAGAEREKVGEYKVTRDISGGSWADLHGKPNSATTVNITAPATPEAQQWDGWGTALKPACEPIVVARKPLSERTVAANVLAHGTGALNIDGCRVALEDGLNMHAKQRRNNIGGGGYKPGVSGQTVSTDILTYKANGRWPANVILDEDAAALLDEQSGERPAGKWMRTDGARPFNNDGKATAATEWKSINDKGGASRFFYVAKASRKERNAGLEGMPEQATQQYGTIRTNRSGGYDETSQHANHHPTVKPIALMRYLVRLVTPPGGLVLDPFMGSGTTGLACADEGFSFIGIEMDDEYIEIARRRIAFRQQSMLQS